MKRNLASFVLGRDWLMSSRDVFGRHLELVLF